MKTYILPIIITLSSVSITVAQTLKLVWTSDTTLRVPESVYYHAEEDMLYVSNINGKSSEKDGNGFISKVLPDGTITSLKWATGLDAPKGMGCLKDQLYVADLTRVVVIDMKSGKILNSIEIDGAQFLNDVTVNTAGEVFVSDSATGNIFRIVNSKAELYFSHGFKRVNGLLAIDDGIYIADAGTGINYILDKHKNLERYTETSQGADGIVTIGNGSYIVSSWSGEVFFVNENKIAVKILDTKERKLNSADIDFNESKNIIYVPTFFGNSVMAYELSAR
ncbi:MAG TPA: ATP/GTP-binding protein [Chryseosolibacter sp.]|nr:ATP/GTP-binding protein [Chryseosolibacter sp.]